tara:strand:- start:5311 stop:5583 length:273 start_codon:yes stop_codon:yes gene_type:complete
MSMPKGHKSENGYATVTGEGKGYREIAEAMTESGHVMNHATARNYFLRAMNKLAQPMAQHSNRTVKELAADPGFQEAIANIIRDGGCISI